MPQAPTEGEVMGKHKKDKKDAVKRSLVDMVAGHEEDLQDVGNALGAVREDISVIVGTLGDLQDRFERLDAYLERQNGDVPVDAEDLTEFPKYARAAVEASNVTGSPHDYLFLYLSDEGPDGPHIIVSDAREFGGKRGIAVGRVEHYESGGDVQVFTSPDKAIKRIAELMRG